MHATHPNCSSIKFALWYLARERNVAHRECWSALNTDYSAFCWVTGRSSRCSASDNYFPYLRSKDPFPISWRICSSPRLKPPEASLWSLASSLGRRGSVVLARSCLYWATPYSRFRDKARLPAFRKLLVRVVSRANLGKCFMVRSIRAHLFLCSANTIPRSSSLLRFFRSAYAERVDESSAT